MERRRARPQVAAVSWDRGWNPGLLLIVVTLGLIVGLGLGLRDQIFRGGVDRDESYLVLAATLYGQDPTPAVAAELRQRLIAVGFANPSVTVLRLADRFAASRDRERQREAEGLRILGETLNVAVEAPAAAGAVSVPTVQAAPILTVPTTAPASPTPAPQPSAAPTAQPATGVPAPATAQPSAAAATAATATPASTPITAPSPTVAPAGPQGTIKTADRASAVLRKEPSTKSAKVAVIPFGTKVQILQTVNGKADDPGIDPRELRWYQIKWGSYTGYIYYKLIDTGG